MEWKILHRVDSRIQSYCQTCFRHTRLAQTVPLASIYLVWCTRFLFVLNSPLQLEECIYFPKIGRGIKKLENETLRHVFMLLRFYVYQKRKIIYLCLFSFSF